MSQVAEMQMSAPAPRVGTRWVLVSVLISLSTLLWLTAAFQVLMVLPRFEWLFLRFAMKAPMVTELVIRHAWWAAPTCFFIAGVTCFTTRSPWVRRICLILVPLLLNVAMALSVYFPYSTLVAALGGQNPFLIAQ